MLRHVLRFLGLAPRRRSISRAPLAPVPVELRDPRPGAVVTQFEANDDARAQGAMGLSYSYYRED